MIWLIVLSGVGLWGGREEGGRRKEGGGGVCCFIVRGRGCFIYCLLVIEGIYVVMTINGFRDSLRGMLV